MKKALLSLLLLMTFSSCENFWESKGHLYIVFKNETNCSIYVDGSFDYPDTSLFDPDPSLSPNQTKVEPFEECRTLYLNMTTYESKFTHWIHHPSGDTMGIDTLIVFVINADTLATYGWECVKNNYLISQRYDVSLNDLQQLNWKLTYPPTVEMRNIKMWPPYGTYDSLGHSIP